MDDLDPTAARAVHQAATDLARARRHAIWLERLAASTFAFGAVSAVVLVVSDVGLVWSALGTLLAAAAVWGVLRGLALLLHLRVDDTMVSLADESGGTDGVDPVDLPAT
ncbi:MAG TPA: hypothetical protein VNS19_08535 [Acidimicrobiales bacterium]|jgi:hypothetical protein|nr:hypothetical protein [Acidimicrobiales bacterium]